MKKLEEFTNGYENHGITYGGFFSAPSPPPPPPPPPPPAQVAPAAKVSTQETATKEDTKVEARPVDRRKRPGNKSSLLSLDESSSTSLLG